MQEAYQVSLISLKAFRQTMRVVHMDSMFLILVCAHSKWPEVVQMKTITSTKTIEALRMIFCRTGIPKQMVSDNGPQFTAGEFENFT